MNLSKITDSELREEIKRRKIAEEKPKMKIDNMVTPLPKNINELKKTLSKVH